MGDTRTYFLLGCTLVRAGFALAFMALIVLSPKILSPKNLFNGQGVEAPVKVRRITHVEPQGHGWIYETIRIYSVLKSHHPRLSDFSAWGMAKAITAESRRHDIDPMLILAVVRVESAFRPEAVSPKGATGLMQILPFVARAVAKEVGLAAEYVDLNLHNPALNVRLGVHYLMQLKDSFKDVRLALVAYNRGPTDVRQRLREKRRIPTGYADKVMAKRNFFNELTPSLLANWAE